ncbi:MAG TPA: hypothetical protein VKQ27_14235 [Acetobacteraceae bacterium]|nr:hypothetical protein [Acetobacteraceae bacterium]
MDTAACNLPFLGADAFLRTHEMLARAYRHHDAGWFFESIAGQHGQVVLPSLGITLPLAALYESVVPEGD